METRVKRRKRKLKKGRVLMAFILLFILVTGGFAGSQYWMGLQASKGAQPFETDYTDSFNGQKTADGKTNILLIGVDSRGEEQSRSDTMMIAQWDGETDTIKLVSLMRDIYTEIPEYGGYKLNTAYYLGGPELLRQTVKENFDIDVEHYMLVDFKAFESVVDAMAPDGIEIDVEKDMSEKIGVSLTEGVHKLNGQELLGYARFRADSEGDFGRVRRQQQVIEAVKDHAVSISGVMKAPKMLGTAQPYIQTSMSSAKGAELLSRILLSGGGEIERKTIPLEGTYTTPTYEGAGSVLEIDWETNRQELKKFLGE
ncbi:LCP family protein [Jeotgalibacillus aurantiacus]|uniref:LCP family protein n=1 Tax=Jeotgalibacillus aurantiacus TaxID=2763266 RepID=UPI001D09DB37|nr:LCP family protein [Jeotgalibacillus aurantiacus]